LLQDKIKHVKPIDPVQFRDELLRGDHTFLSKHDLSKIPYRVKEKAAENIVSILKGFVTRWNKYKIKKRKKKCKKKKKKQCAYIFTRGASKNLQCVTMGYNTLCGTHRPKIYCDQSKCKCQIFKTLKTCKKHASETDLQSLMCNDEHCKAYHLPHNVKCSKHNVNKICIESNCNQASRGDYCFHHALQHGVRFKARNRKNNKYFSLNQRDWTSLQNRLGVFYDATTMNIVEEPTGEMTFIYNLKIKEWRMVYTIYKEKYTPLSDRKLLCSLDPGERTPYTLYSFDDGQVIDISSRCETQKKLTLLRDKHDKYKSYKKCTSQTIPDGKEKSKILRQLNRLQMRHMNKASNRVKDAQWKLAHWLCSRYQYIILPEFNTSKMALIRSGLPKFVRKNLLAWNHAKFRCIMKMVAARYNTYLIIGPEIYSTKTCVMCRRLTDVGSNETFKCRFEDCDFEGPRDVCGAMNNGLQYLL
jgi:hypothetical protein